MSVALSLQAAESGEPRGLDSPGQSSSKRRKGWAPRPGSTELGEPLRGLGQAKGASPASLARIDCRFSRAAPLRSPPEASLALRDLPVRVFVALFDYDPVSMSPNPDAGEEELPFREGQILKVTDSLSGPASSLLSCLVLEGW